MNPITRMMKSCIQTPLKYKLPLLLIGALILVSTTGCVTNTTTKNESGGGSGNAGVDVIVNSKQVSDQLGSGYLAETPKAGYHYLIFNVTVKNLNEKDWTIGDPYDFKLTTTDGSVYQSTSASLGTYALESVSHTSPGEKVTGQIAFEIPDSTQPMRLQYDDYTNSVVVNIESSSVSTPIPAQVTSTSQKVVGDKTTFTSTGFSITYLKSLVNDSSTDPSNPVREYIYLAKNNTIDAVTVATGNINAGATLDYWKTYNINSINTYPNYQKLSDTTTTLAGKPADIVVWQGTVPEQMGDNAVQHVTLKVMQTFVINNNTGYVVTYKAIASDYDTYLAQAQQIINSFSLT